MRPLKYASLELHHLDYQTSVKGEFFDKRRIKLWYTVKAVYSGHHGDKIFVRFSQVSALDRL